MTARSQRFPDALTCLLVSWVPALILVLRSRFPPCCHRTFCKLLFVVVPVVVIPIPLGISSPPTVTPGSRWTGAWWWSVVGKISGPIIGQPNQPLLQLRIESVNSMSFLFQDVFYAPSFPNSEWCYPFGRFFVIASYSPWSQLTFKSPHLSVTFTVCTWRIVGTVNGSDVIKILAPGLIPSVNLLAFVVS